MWLMDSSDISFLDMPTEFIPTTLAGSEATFTKVDSFWWKLTLTFSSRLVENLGIVRMCFGQSAERDKATI